MSDHRPTNSILWPSLAALLGAWALIATLIAIWAYRRPAEPVEVVDSGEPVEDLRVLRAASFEDLTGWNDDEVSQAMPAIRRSCELFGKRDPGRQVGPEGLAGTISDWQAPCAALSAASDDASLRAVFETQFRPLQVLNHQAEVGLFTGYYEPSLRGSRTRSAEYSVPLYRKPSDLLTIDLEAFHDRYAGSRISGRIGDGTFKPYFERAEISQGALDGRQLELVWVDDPVDAFFLQIQGSGRVALDDGTEMRVGYGGQNGRPYYAIGRELVERGALILEEVSLQSIRRWLADNPTEAEAVMSTNRSFVFFDELEGQGPLGTMGLPLTPGRSLAIDRDQLPLGVPLWLDAQMPTEDEADEGVLQRLMVAQDTGGAIKGPVRGDVFWGHGAEAEFVAGHMKHDGRLFLLLPTAVAQRHLRADD